MTTSPPDDTDPSERERSAAEIDAQFAAIVAAISGSMSWDNPGEPTASTGGAGAATDARRGSADHPTAPDRVHPTDLTGAGPSAADRQSAEYQAAEAARDRRRALRRAQRAEEVELFTAAQAAAEAELQADDAHFTPPDPPPVPRPGRRTVVALLLMALGLFLLLRPGLLQVGADVVLVLAMTCLVGGFGILVWNLRPRAADPDDADGWDDGARL